MHKIGEPIINHPDFILPVLMSSHGYKCPENDLKVWEGPCGLPLSLVLHTKGLRSNL